MTPRNLGMVQEISGLGLTLSERNSKILKHTSDEQPSMLVLASVPAHLFLSSAELRAPRTLNPELPKP